MKLPSIGVAPRLCKTSRLPTESQPATNGQSQHSGPPPSPCVPPMLSRRTDLARASSWFGRAHLLHRRGACLVSAGPRPTSTFEMASGRRRRGHPIGLRGARRPFAASCSRPRLHAPRTLCGAAAAVPDDPTRHPLRSSQHRQTALPELLSLRMNQREEEDRYARRWDAALPPQVKPSCTLRLVARSAPRRWRPPTAPALPPPPGWGRCRRALLLRCRRSGPPDRP